MRLRMGKQRKTPLRNLPLLPNKDKNKRGAIMYKNLALEGINEDKSPMPMSNTDIILMDIAYLLKDIRDLKYKDLKNRSIIE